MRLSSLSLFFFAGKAYIKTRGLQTSPEQRKIKQTSPSGPRGCIRRRTERPSAWPPLLRLSDLGMDEAPMRTGRHRYSARTSLHPASASPSTCSNTSPSSYSLSPDPPHRDPEGGKRPPAPKDRHEHTDGSALLWNSAEHHRRRG